MLCVIWLQGGTCFILWIAYGVLQTRRSASIRQWAVSVSRSRRSLLAAALMIGSILPVFAVLTLALQFHGFGNNGMAIGVWLGVSFFGLLFVHGQTLATALLVTVAQESVTGTRVESSRTDTSKENDHHEASSS